MLERYSRPEMRELWTLENKFRVWLEVELAVTKGWTEMGEVPREAVMKSMKGRLRARPHS